MPADPVITGIQAAAAVLSSGDRESARSQLEQIWASVSADPEPFHVCVLAHFMADVQDDIADELAWDLRALEAALQCTDADAERHGYSLSMTSFMPSLRVSLAQDYYRQGDFELAGDHLAAAHTFVSHLGDDEYGRLIRGAMERLAKGLDRRTARPGTSSC